MKASAWEFRHRALLNGAVFLAGFTVGSVRPGAVAARLAGMPGSPASAATVRTVCIAATLVLLLAAGIRTWGTAYLGAPVVFSSGVHTDALVADGPYRYVRNPLYLGTLLLGAGLGVLAGPWGWAIIVLGLALVQHRLVAREEALLDARLGEPVRAYRARVARWLPGLRPRLPAGGADPDWKAAWKAEAPMWCFAAAMASVAATLSLRPFQVLVIVGVVLLVVSHRRGAQPARPGG
ncbi:MAG: methyltransferase [Gemmatimonadota bacterium]|jgi:protein-S-isoprenylcysteine O-methyltransferase Ste14